MSEAKRLGNKRWYEKNRDKVLAQKREPARRDAANKSRRERHRELREEFLAAYGNECECCGETQKHFLTIEHRDGGGKKHRGSVGAAGVLQDMKRQGWPKDKYALLCYNCNCARGFYGFCHVV